MVTILCRLALPYPGTTRPTARPSTTASLSPQQTSLYTLITAGSRLPFLSSPLGIVPKSTSATASCPPRRTHLAHALPLPLPPLPLAALALTTTFFQKL